MSPSTHTRVCPTRIDAAAPLFSHRLTTEQCQSRQRGRYHKCFTCVFNNAFVAGQRPEPRGGRSQPELAVRPEPVKPKIAKVGDEPASALPENAARAV